MGYFEKIENPMLNNEVPFQEKIVGYCENCKGEIYEGEDVFQVDGGCFIHRDVDELIEWYQVKKGNLYENGEFER